MKKDKDIWTIDVSKKGVIAVCYIIFIFGISYIIGG